jgi:hypothetical protein
MRISKAGQGFIVFLYILAKNGFAAQILLATRTHGVKAVNTRSHFHHARSFEQHKFIHLSPVLQQFDIPSF